jgi:methenyltetrahydrofolate cyclohydrolase
MIRSKLSLTAYLDQLASADPTPGGGSAAAVSAALGAALGSMVSAISSKSRDAEGLEPIAAACTTYRETFMQLAEEDERAFREVMAALRRSKQDPDRQEALQRSLNDAASVPLCTAETCLELLGTLSELTERSTRHCVSDVGAAAHLSLAALRAALLSVHVNLSLMTLPQRAQTICEAADRIESQALVLSEQVATRVMDRIRGSS